jgi:hypothetical protein
MNTSVGKMLILFRTAQIEKHDKIPFLDTGLVVATPENPNDFSLEVAEVYAVSKTQEFFKPGDKVLVDYTIFQQGKDKTRVKSRTRKFSDVPEGELYYAFDGGDNWNRTEVYAAFDGDSLRTHPTKVLINAAAKDQLAVSGGGIIHTRKEDRDQPFWATVIAGPEGFEKGSQILVEGAHAQPIYYEGKEIAIVDVSYLLALK